MPTWLDSSACAVMLYALGATTAFVLGGVEQRRRSSDLRLWPTFWFATGWLLLLMALGRAGNVGDLLTEIGRQQARSEGWYEARRSLQAWVIGAVAILWAITIARTVRRVPERRRRYLPTAIVVLTLFGFAGIRIISLHQVDALLHKRVRGITVGDAVEIGLLLLVVAVSAWRYPRSNRQRPDGDPEPRPEIDAGRPLAG